MKRSPQDRPPAVADRFLRWICPLHLYEGIAGDLAESFAEDLHSTGPRRARLNYWINVLRFARPGIVFRNRITLNVTAVAMLKNYFQVSMRSLSRHASYTFVTIGGLTLSFTIAIALFMTVKFERGFDSHHQNAERIYQIMSNDKFGETTSHVPSGVISALREFTGTAQVAHCYNFTPSFVSVAGETMESPNAFFVHPDMLRMLDVEWVSGSPETSLSKPYQVVLDEQTAAKLFKGRAALGETIRYENSFDLTVSGIIKNAHPQTQFRFEMLVSYGTMKRYMPWLDNDDYWEGGDSMQQGFVMLKDGVSGKDAERMLTERLKKHGGNTNYVSFDLIQLSEMHFNADTDPMYYVVPEWSLQVLTIVAWTLIALAAINFINMATAQASMRNKEVGVRKTMGGTRRGIIAQFMIETFMIVSLSAVLATVLAGWLIPVMPSLFSTHITVGAIWGPDVWFGIAALIVTVTILAGLYPSLVLSRVAPARMLQQKVTSAITSRLTIRKVLVVGQFFMAQVMLICIIIGGRQMEMFRSADLGFDKSNVFTVAMPYQDSTLIRERFRHELLKSPFIREVSYSLTSPSSLSNHWWTAVAHPGLMDGEAIFRMQWIDDQYLTFYHIPLLAGRNFLATDTGRIALINATAVRSLGFAGPEEALGAVLTYYGNSRATVVGVVADFHSQGLKSATPPHMLLPGYRNLRLAQVKFLPSEMYPALKTLQKTWTQHHPEHYFQYALLSDSLKKFYVDEEKLIRAITIFSWVGLAVCCLGLFALVSFVCARRTKELSIRKVLGASVTALITLLSSEFIVLVIVAFVLAVPFARYIMGMYLRQYANHVEIGWTPFAWAAVITLCLAVFTVALRSYRAAIANPAPQLKQE